MRSLQAGASEIFYLLSLLFSFFLKKKKKKKEEKKRKINVSQKKGKKKRKESRPAVTAEPLSGGKRGKTVIKPDSRREKSLTAFKDSLLSSPPGNKPLARSRRPKNGFLPGLPSRRLFDSFLSSSRFNERRPYVGGGAAEATYCGSFPPHDWSGGARGCCAYPRRNTSTGETNLRRTDGAG